MFTILVECYFILMALSLCRHFHLLFLYMSLVLLVCISADVNLYVITIRCSYMLSNGTRIREVVCKMREVSGCCIVNICIRSL